VTALETAARSIFESLRAVGVREVGYRVNTRQRERERERKRRSNEGGGEENGKSKWYGKQKKKRRNLISRITDIIEP